ncbi:DUF4397 domain-containing protein [Pedobacter sp. ASV1-7]|uniref:DUF4397 domain-containing protein n=1 Tax=Pedobacter sp. ASV1-7 TaxID=3145237 RepID=UPI0032E8E225
MKPSFLLSSKAGKVFMVVCLSIIVLVASCGKKYDPVPEPVGDAKVRYVNTVLNSDPQDFYVNGAKKGIEAVAYGEVSDYLTITSGSNAFSFYNTGTTTVNTTTQAYNFPIGISGTVFYVQSQSGPKGAFAIGDDMSAPAAGKAKVRFINVNSFAGSNPISVSVVGETGVLIPSLMYIDLERLAYFSVEPAAKFKITMNSTTIEFDPGIVAGKNYTIWIDGSSATTLTAHAILQN